MATNGTGEESAARTAAQCATTHWSVVLAAGDSASPESKEAMEKLCRDYWYPVYAYVRRHGFGPEDAEDITQEFFAGFLEKGYLSRADPKAGRLRPTFPAADPVRVGSGRQVIVFNVGGHGFRLICAVHFNSGMVFALRFLSHAEYSKDSWKSSL